jgi:hypothetical protein
MKVEFVPDPGRQGKQRSVLVDVNVVVLALDVRDAPIAWLSIRARTLSSNRPADQASLHARRTSTANAKNPVMDFAALRCR